MATPAKCDKHLFEDATGICRACHEPFCDDCLVHTRGSSRTVLCVPCALTAAGVRSTAAIRTQHNGSSIGVAGKVTLGLFSTAAAAAVAVPALSHLH